MASGAHATFLILRRACSSVATATATAPPKTRKKKNLVEVLRFLPNWGLGAKVMKGHWNADTYYHVTKIQLFKDARHGAAWGVFHDSGAPKTGVIEKIGGVNKRCWRYIREEAQGLKKP